MSAQPKRIPGQTNAEYEYSGKLDPNVQFLGTHSSSGGGLSWVGRLYNAIADRIAARRNRT